MSPPVILQIPGEPMAQPRQRHGLVKGKVRNWTPSSHPVNDYKAAIRLAWQAAGGELCDGPVNVGIFLTFPRPKSMMWKRREMPMVRHTKKPDAENVAKAVLDALTGLAYRDDSQVCQLIVAKWIAGGTDQPMTRIDIDPIVE